MPSDALSSAKAAGMGLIQDVECGYVWASTLVTLVLLMVYQEPHSDQATSVPFPYSCYSVVLPFALCMGGVQKLLLSVVLLQCP